MADDTRKAFSTSALRKAKLALLNDVADSPHRFRHHVAFAALVEQEGFVVKDLDHGRIDVRDPVADADAADAAAKQAELDAAELLRVEQERVEKAASDEAAAADRYANPPVEPLPQSRRRRQ